jgi:hypothetical protein
MGTELAMETLRSTSPKSAPGAMGSRVRVCAAARSAACASRRRRHSTFSMVHSSETHEAATTDSSSTALPSAATPARAESSVLAHWMPCAARAQKASC